MYIYIYVDPSVIINEPPWIRWCFNLTVSYTANCTEKENWSYLTTERWCSTGNRGSPPGCCGCSTRKLWSFRKHGWGVIGLWRPLCALAVLNEKYPRISVKENLQENEHRMLLVQSTKISFESYQNIPWILLVSSESSLENQASKGNLWSEDR